VGKLTLMTRASGTQTRQSSLGLKQTEWELL
jgi:hypothetical protein